MLRSVTLKVLCALLRCPSGDWERIKREKEGRQEGEEGAAIDARERSARQIIEFWRGATYCAAACHQPGKKIS